MSKITMGQPRSRTRITREGEFEEYLEIEYFVNDARFTLNMDKEGYTAAKAEDAVKKAAAEICNTTGKTITL